MRRNSSVPYARLNVENGESSRSTMRGGDRGLWALTILAVILSTLVFILVLNKRLADGSARQMVREERQVLETALEKLAKSLILENNVLVQKNVSHELEVNCVELQYWVGNNTGQIEVIDDLSSLFTSINEGIQSIETDYNTQITTLESTLDGILSHAETNATTEKSGTCTFQGLNSTTVTYAYKKLTVNGLDYYYYVFSPTSSEILVDNSGFAIQSCTPTIYEGPTNSVNSPIFIRQIDSFVGTGKSNIRSLTAGNSMLQFQMDSFAGTKSIGIGRELSNFVSFF